MSSNSSGAERRYWLMIGQAPSGPFTVAQIHAKLAAKEVTWETSACPLGDSSWLPLLQTPGVGPTPASEEIPAAIPVTPAAGSPNTRRGSDPRQADRPVPEDHRPAGNASSGVQSPARPLTWAGVGVGIVVFLFLAWIVYGWVRPLTPREVCERMDKAKTAQEAKKYCTLNLHPFLDDLYRKKLPDTDDPFEYTQEGDAPAEVGGYFVGFRGQIYFPEERRRVQLDGVIHLIKSDGWKIEDMYFLSVDRQPLPQAISVARDYHLFQQPQAGQFAQAPRGPSSSTMTSTQAKT